MKTNISIILLFMFMLVGGGGCSTQDGEQKQAVDEDHFLKDKTDVLDDAKKTEQMLKESEQRKRKSLEEQTQ